MMLKKSKVGDGFELVLFEKTSVASSAKKFKIDETTMACKVDVQKLDCLSEVDKIAVFIGNKVSVVGKIASIKEVEDIKLTREAGRVFKKQECVLIDKSKACRLVVWEDLVKSMESATV